MAESPTADNPFSAGSPTGAQAAGSEMDGMEVARRMLAATEAAVLAAQAASRAAESASNRPSDGDGKQWCKLLPKPPPFDHSTRESEISSWKEWSWLFEQYMASVDSRFSDDIQQVRDHVEQQVDPVDFTDMERQRNSFLYSLLSSLVRQRALLVVKQVSNSNGLEAYRLLIQQNEPLSKNRSMGLLNVIMNWPAFNGKTSLMQQVLKLENAYAEYEKLGSRLNDDLKTAILMRSVTGQLKTWLQLQVSESTTYAKVREMILLYDASTRKWSEQMVLGTDAAASNSDGPIPMEIDRVQWKGKSKSGKGKTKDKNGYKGKSKGKEKGKEYKGKGKANDQKGKGNGSERSKGKGKGDSKPCYVCGKQGHFARDCWQATQGSQVRQVAGDNSTSASSTVGGMTSVSQQSGQQQPVSPMPATQYRVSRILEIAEVEDDVEPHTDLIFDMRDLSPSSFHGSVKAVYYYIGDSSDECDDSCSVASDDACCFSGAVRTMVEQFDVGCSDFESLNILIDSGADASIFPSSVLGRGHPAMSPAGKLVDAQGVEIPIMATKDIEVCLKDVGGRNIKLKETVAISDRVSQPIICYGHLLQSGWGVDAQNRTLFHAASGVAIPLELQQNSMVVCGTIRAIHEQLPSENVSCIRAIQAEVDPGIVNGAVGWELDLRGCGVGRHFANRCQDPTMVKPDIPGSFCRTTLVQVDAKWFVIELCERLDGLVQLDSEFHELNGNRNVIHHGQ